MAWLSVLALLMSSAGMAFANDSTVARRRMVDEIERLSRLVAKETGQAAPDARVLEAMGRLANGAPVTQVALDLGYESVSAFSAMFRRAAGASPSAFRHQP